jgi:hypothetical protein
MEGYTIEEVVKCCVDYVKDEKWISFPYHYTRVDSEEEENGSENFC